MKATSAVFLAAAGASLSAATPTPFAIFPDSNLLCPGPDGDFCVGDGLSTLLSCVAGVPEPAVDCGAQTAGQPPLGSIDASCYQSSPIAGDAACTKNCVVYPSNGGSSYPVPGACTPPEASTSDQQPPSYPFPGAPQAEAFAPQGPMEPTDPTAPMDSMPEGIESSFSYKGPVPPMFPPMMLPTPPSYTSEAPLEVETSSAPPSIAMPPSIPPMMMPTEASAAPTPDVYTKPFIQASSEPAPEVFTKPLIQMPSAPSMPPPILETPTPTPAAPPVMSPPEMSPPAISSPEMAPPAVSSVEAPPAPPVMPSPPALSTPPTAANATPTTAYSIAPFLSHILGSFMQPPPSSLPLPTTDMIASSTIPMTLPTHTFASPSPSGPGVAYTYPTPSDFSLLPTATLPAYVTTVTVGTKTNYHTIFSDCGNGTMIFGSSTITLPTGSTPNEVPLWQTTEGASLPPTPTLTTLPCSDAASISSSISIGGWNQTTPAMHTPKATSSKEYSYIATLPAGATGTPEPNSQFSQGDGFDHQGGAAAGLRVSGEVVALVGFLCGIAAMAL